MLSFAVTGTFFGSCFWVFHAMDVLLQVKILNMLYIYMLFIFANGKKVEMEGTKNV